jgi:hypothetical protein
VSSAWPASGLPSSSSSRLRPWSLPEIPT